MSTWKFFRAKLQNTPQLWSASLTCVGRLWRSRHNTIDAILIQWHVNELRGILKLLLFQIINCTCPTGLCNFVVFEKDSCLLTPNFTQNHVITYTNFIPSFSCDAKTDCLICRLLTGFGLLLSLLCLLLSWKTKSQYLLYQRHFVLCPIHSKSILQKNFPLVYFVWTLSDLTF